jgi:hypothetical protein
MSSSMRLAMSAAAGSRGRVTGSSRDFDARTVARFAGFPAIMSPVGLESSAKLANAGGKIVFSIVNNIEYGYHPKKVARQIGSDTNRQRIPRRQWGGNGMTKARKDSVGKIADRALSKRHSRREFMIKTALAAGAFGAVPLRGWAADPINIGALYPTTGSMAQIGVGCVAAAKLAVDMVNEGGGIKSLGGAKLNLIISDVQSDTTVTRTETDRLITGNKLSAIHGCYASALTLIASEVAERAKVPLITGSSSDQLNKGRAYTFTPFARASQFAKAQLQMAKLVGDAPKVAVIFENTAFGTSTSNG